MRRRRFVATVVSASTATALAGCAGYTVQRQDDVERREKRIEDLEDAVESHERELDERRTRVRRGEAETVSDLYATGHGRFETAESQFATAEANEGEGNYATAAQSFGRAHGNYASAKAAMDRAVTAAGEAELTDVQSLVEESAFALSFYAGAAGNYADENLLRDRGEDARADDFEREGDNAYSSARGRPVHGPTTVDGRLGL